ncbi:MAG: hypothetical protein AB3N09_01430 [Tateyamaria sp.]
MSRKKQAIAAAFGAFLAGAAPSAIASPLTQFATCAERYAVMDHYGPQPQGDDYATRSAWFADLVDAVRSTSVTDEALDDLRLDARVTVMVLLYQQRFSFDARVAEGARRALHRTLRECDGLTLG